MVDVLKVQVFKVEVFVVKVSSNWGFQGWDAHDWGLISCGSQDRSSRNWGSQVEVFPTEILVFSSEFLLGKQMIKDQEGAKELVKRADKFWVHSRFFPLHGWISSCWKKCRARSAFVNKSVKLICLKGFLILQSQIFKGKNSCFKSNLTFNNKVLIWTNFNPISQMFFKIHLNVLCWMNQAYVHE